MFASKIKNSIINSAIVNTNRRLLTLVVNHHGTHCIYEHSGNGIFVYEKRRFNQWKETNAF